MIKFWKDDFRYVHRLGLCEPFGYIFSVRGESANYLINKYDLDFEIVFVNCHIDKTIYVGSKKEDGTKSDCADCELNDIDELYGILLSFINVDMINYEDYLCDDWYKKDSRWE